MIITLNNADFSTSNIGTLSVWRVITTLGKGAVYSGATSVEKNGTLTATVTLNNNYSIALAGITVTMDNVILENVYTISDNIITFTISNVTNNIFIKVPTIKISTEASVITDLSGYEKQLGYIGTANTWNNINNKYQHVVVPIWGATTLEVTANAEQALFIAGLKTFSGAINGETPDYSVTEPWNRRITVGKGTNKTYTVPSDVNYLVFFIIVNEIDAMPESIRISMEG